MTQPLPNTMKAAAIDRFGGPETLVLRTLPVPEPGPDEVLIRIEVAGVGEWDPFEREGGYAQMLGLEPTFPYVLGSEGAGAIVAVGEQVSRFEEGDRVYAAGFLNPKGGFYAEYAAVNAGLVSRIPAQLTIEQAGVTLGVAITALRGLDDTLRLQAGEVIAIVGASGGVGHVAVQLARRMGARVLAIASGDDGVALTERLGADATIDGRASNVSRAIREFAPTGLDAVLLTAGGEVAKQTLSEVRNGGRVAYPSGVRPEPELRTGIEVQNYNGEPDREIIERLDRFIVSGPFEVHVARSFPIDRAAEAHRALDEHYLGKLALRVR